MDWTRVKSVLDEALQRPPAERAGFVESSCADDPGVLIEVKHLLEVGDRASGFFVEPTIDHVSDAAINAAFASVPLGIDAGAVIGRYKILQQIGEGGFGIVYMAEQERPVRRRVALKILKPGVDTKQVLARFEAERQALAVMDHPSIATVLDAGETDAGRPYFVMELVPGDPITTFCDRESLSTEQRLRLFRTVCSAVQHAHMKGVIHRDLKPSNILVGMLDGKPVPKVIDFGVAKATSTQLTDRTLFTEFRQLIGTPEYMSPEQADTASLADVDTRTDVYSLGVLLYELLTGAPPFPARELREAGYGEMLRIIREADPPKPSTRLSTMGDSLDEIARQRRAQPHRLGTLVRGELDWIVMKALEKDRGRRYNSAEDFARDVDRYLADDAVEASPPSKLYRTRKLVRRNRVVVSAAALVLIALVLGVVGTTSGLFWALGERSIAREATESAVESEMVAREAAYEALMLSAGQAKRDGKYAESADLLDRIQEEDRSHWWRVARASSTMGYQTLAPVGGRFRWNADHSLVSAIFTDRLEIRDGETFELLRTLRDLSPNGRRVKWTTDPNTLMLLNNGAELVDARTLERIGPQIDVTQWFRTINPGVVGDRFFVGHRIRGDDLSLLVIDLTEGRVRAERIFPGLATLAGVVEPAGGDWFWCFNQNGGGVLAASVSDLNTSVMIDGRTTRLERPWTSDQGVVLWHEGQLVECWWLDDSGTPAYGWTFPAQSRITGYQVRDGVAIIKAVRSVHLIDVATGEQLTQPIDVGASASFVDLDRDGGRLLVDTVGAGVRLYDLDEWREPHAAPIALTSGRSMRLAPDGMLAVCANWDPHFLLEAGGVLLIDPLCGVEVARLLEPGVSGHPLAIDPSGSHFATVTSVRGSAQATRTLVVWSLRSGRRLWTKSLADTPHWFEWSLRFNEDGSRVVLAPFEYGALDGRQRAGPELVTDVSAEYLVGRSEPERSLDIRYAGLASSSWLEVIRRDTGETVQRFEAPESFLLPHARISNEETLIAIPQRQAPVRVYEIETGRLIGALPDYTTDTLRIEWSPDDSVFATVGEDAVVRLWNGESLVLLAVLSGHTSYIQEVAFAPDNRSLYTISGDGSFRTWNTRTSAQQADFVAARKLIHDRLRPKVARIVDESVREDAADAWAALAALGLEGEDADVGHLILTGMLLERFGQ